MNKNPKSVARVLLVEDDEDDFILTSEYLHQLASHSFEIDWVTNPTKALEQLNLGKHDICLLDYQLGAYNGLTVLERASENGCSIPIIMLTGQSDEALDQSALAAGAVDYLVKSEMTTARFARAIRYALARQEIENERLERINAETQNQSKDRFLAHLSHELRTPLTSILGYTEILLNSNKAPNAEPELNIILNNGQHLLGLLNNVLDLSKIAVGKLEYNFSTINVDSFIADIFCLMQVHAADKGLTLKMHAKNALPLQIYSDPVRLRQVLINLIGNSIKFTEDGKIYVIVKLLNIINDKVNLRFEIEDNGPGIPKEKQKMIFENFSQLDDNSNTNYQGTGLGLPITKNLVELFGSQLEVESEIDLGSTFSFDLTLDIDRAIKANIVKTKKAKGDAISLTKKYKILVAEDNKINQIVTQNLLQRENYECVIAKNGKDFYMRELNSTLVSEFILSKTMNFKTNKKFVWVK